MKQPLTISFQELGAGENWLDQDRREKWLARNKSKIDAIRKRNQAKWQKRQKELHDYDPDQPRDPRGRWVGGFVDYAQNTPEELNRIGKTITNNPKLTDNEQLSLSAYTSDLSGLINRELRGAPQNELDRLIAQGHIKTLDSILAKSVLNENVILRRYISVAHSPNPHPGDEITEKGFMSSTLGNAYSLWDHSSQEVEIELHVPKGTHAISVDALGKYSGFKDYSPSEHEFILPHGTTYLVKSVSRSSIVAEVVHAANA